MPEKEVIMSRRVLPRDITLTIVLLSIVLLISGCETPEGNSADGKRWYTMHTCYACHGKHGDNGKGPKIAGIDMSYRSFVHRLRNAQTAIMPEYDENKISDQDAADILAYLKNLK